MHSAKFLTELQAAIPSSESPVVISALRQDPLVWEWLSTEGNFEKAIARVGSHLIEWNPSKLALIAIDENLNSQDLASSPLIPLEKTLRQRALKAYENSLVNGKAPAALSEAGLVALALRERRRLTEGWSDFSQELSRHVAASVQTVHLTWRTPLACLYGIISDPRDMLQSLLPDQDQGWIYPVLSHIIFSIPLTLTERTGIFSELIKSLAPRQQISFLRVLNLEGNSDLTAEIAGLLLQGLPAQPEAAQKEVKNSEEALSQALENQHLAALYHLANQPDVARSLLSKARQSVQFWLGGLAVQITETGSPGAEAELLDLSQDLEFAVNSKDLKDEAALALENLPLGSSSVLELCDDPSSPYILIQRAALQAENGEPGAAQELARQAVDLFEQQFIANEGNLPVQFIYNWQPSLFVQRLLDLDLPDDALKVAELLLQNRPSDQQLISLASKSLVFLGEYEQAADYARISVLLDPANPDRRRAMAEVLEAMGESEEAHAERQQVVELAQEPDTNDLIAYSTSAIRLNQVAQAIDASRRALELDPNQDQAYAIIGRALMEQGQYDEAARYIDNAISLMPGEASYWLTLAKIHENNNNSTKQLETLREARLAVPASAEINYALATACLKMGLYTEALPLLRQAAMNAPDSIEVVDRLGGALYSLGRYEELRQVLETSRQKWPDNPDLAVLYAKTLLELGDRENAVPALETAIQSESPNPEWLRLYVKSLLNCDLTPLSCQSCIDYPSLVNAHKALEKALALNPNDLESRMLLAEVKAAKNDLTGAYENYQSLVDKPELITPEVRWRIQAGLGEVAMGLNKPDVALAALQEATQGMPEYVNLQRLLAEAYRSANLIQEAKATARTALKLAPEDLTNIMWFANFMSLLNEEAEATKALACATQLDPNCPDNWIKLASLQIQAGDLSAARESLKILMGMDGLSENQLRQAAYAFLRLQDWASALACLENAVKPGVNASAELLFEISALLWKNGNLPAALASIQKAAAVDPNNACLYLFQSDILTELNRPQASLVCLEHALHLVETREEVGLPESWRANLVGGVLPKVWIESINSPAAIHTRFAYLYRDSGNIPLALQHARLALEYKPDDPDMRYMAAELAYSLLNNEQAAEFTGLFESPGSEVAENQSNKPISGEQLPALPLIAQAVEISLDAGDLMRVGQLLQMGASISADYPRLLAAQSRLLVRMEDWKGAKVLYDNLIAKFKASAVPGDSTSLNSFNPFIQKYKLPVWQEGWLAEAALELEQWGDALALFSAADVANPGEARPHYQLARALVICAEKQRLCQELKCETHAPGADKLGQESYQAFEKAIELAAHVSDAAIIGRLKARGQAVFYPDPASVQTLLGYPPTLEELPSYIASLRYVNNCAEAIELAGQIGQTPEVLLQLALCYERVDPVKAIELSHKAVEGRPINPLCHATLAKEAEIYEQLDVAHQAIETALSIWPDEPDWQAWAGYLAEQTGSVESALAHREKAFALKPSSLEYMLALGRANLSVKNGTKAIEHLEAALQQAPERSDIWLMMALAHRQNGSLEESLECARRAAELDALSAEPALLAGELALAVDKKDLALEYAQNAIRRDETNPKAVLFLSELLVKRGNLKDGLAAIEKSIKETEPSAQVLLERAKLVYRLQGPMAALPYLQELAQNEPDDISVLNLLAQVQFDCGNLNAAEQAAIAALKLQPVSPGLNLLLGRVHRQSGQLDQAIHYLSEAIREAPSVLEPYLELGLAYQDRREPLQALKSYREATKVAPNDYRAFYSGGLVLREIKDYLGAEAMLRRAAHLSPDDLNIQRQLGAVIALNLVHNSQEANSYL